jgi:hypothetical protein
MTKLGHAGNELRSPRTSATRFVPSNPWYATSSTFTINRVAHQERHAQFERAINWQPRCLGHHLIANHWWTNPPGAIERVLSSSLARRVTHAVLTDESIVALKTTTEASDDANHSIGSSVTHLREVSANQHRDAHA